MKNYIIIFFSIFILNSTVVYANTNVGIYEVKHGDTLFGIAFKHNMNISDFLKINNISNYDTYKLKRNTKLYIRTWDDKKNESKIIDERKIEIYIAKSDDTLSEIAEKQKMGLTELYSLNNINKNYLLKKDDKIKVYKSKIPISKPSSKSSDKHIVTYVIKRGDSLLLIALRENMNFSELCKINNIKDANEHVLKVGDKIKIVKQVDGIKKHPGIIEYPKVDFIWPYGGKITQKYGKNSKNIGNRGINISGKVGDNIHATSDGIIDYVGKIRGFGEVVILSHDNDYNTIYAHLSESNMKEGNTVKKNDIIGKVGSTGFTDKNALHFKIFYKGRPVDPIKILPKK